MKKLLFAVCCALASAVHVQAVIIYNGDNNTNTTTYGMELGLEDYWNSVVTINGYTAVYLGNGCFLTAKHVAPPTGDGRVNININDNVVSYAYDTLFGTKGVLKVEDLPGVGGNVDLVIVRILDAPDLLAVTLNTSTNEGAENSYIVGYGKGKGNPIANGWEWGNDSTRAKRWGFTAKPMAMTQTYLQEGQYGVPEAGYYWLTDPNSSKLLTFFSPSFGENIAMGIDKDSGSPLFQNIGGKWVLSGVAVGASPTIYNMNPMASGYTAYERMSTYASAINSVVSAYSIPEPSTWFLLGAGVVFVALVRRRK